MAALIPPSFAARDMLLAAGLGFLLAVAYRAARLVLPGRAGVFLCDALAGLCGTLALRSAAVSRFYAGMPRWYTLGAMALCFAASARALRPAFRRLGRLAGAPAAAAKAVLRALWAPAAARLRHRREKTCEKRRSMSKKTAKKNESALQKRAQVLYNSFNSPPAGG